MVKPVNTHTMSNTQNPYPPKTARWWFAEYLPEPYRGQAIENYDPEYFNDENGSESTSSLYHAVSVGFYWAGSIQGRRYWMQVAERISIGEFSTPNTHEPTAEQTQSATASFAGVDTDAYMDEVRGRDKVTVAVVQHGTESGGSGGAGKVVITTLKVYHFETAQFEAVVSCADLQGAMDLLFAFLINSCAFTFRFDISNVCDVSDADDVPVFEKAGVVSFRPIHK